MWYSPEIRRFKYYQLTQGWGGAPATLTKLQSCERIETASNKAGMTCDEHTGWCCDDINNGWNNFPTYGQWAFAYYEEKKRTTGRITILGKDCNCGVAKSRQAFGAKLAAVSIWRDALSDAAVETLANGHLPASHRPIAAYIGDYAHDQDQRWPRAGVEGGAESIINESPPAESFAKGALHYEEGLPTCIHYFNAAETPFSRWNQVDGDGVLTKDGTDGDGDYGPPPTASAAYPDPNASPSTQYPQPVTQYPQPGTQYPQTPQQPSANSAPQRQPDAAVQPQQVPQVQPPLQQGQPPQQLQPPPQQVQPSLQQGQPPPQQGQPPLQMQPPPQQVQPPLQQGQPPLQQEQPPQQVSSPVPVQPAQEQPPQQVSPPVPVQPAPTVPQMQLDGEQLRAQTAQWAKDLQTANP